MICTMCRRSRKNCNRYKLSGLNLNNGLMNERYFYICDKCEVEDAERRKEMVEAIADMRIDDIRLSPKKKWGENNLKKNIKKNIDISKEM